MRRGGEGVWRWGEREIIYLSLQCHHQNGTCIKTGSDESHFNVSVGSDGQSHREVSTNHNLFDHLRCLGSELISLSATANYKDLGICRSMANYADFVRSMANHVAVVSLQLTLDCKCNAPLSTSISYQSSPVLRTHVYPVPGKPCGFCGR